MVNIPGAPGFYQAFGRTEIDNGDGTYTLRVNNTAPSGQVSSVSLAYPIVTSGTSSQSVFITGQATPLQVSSVGINSISLAYPISATATLSGIQSNSISFPVTLTQPQTVTATNLGTRPLTSASDTVGAVQSGTWNVNVLGESGISSESIAFPVSVLSHPVTATNLGIRPLTSASDTVAAVQSGTWNTANVSQIIGDVRATNLGTRPLTSASDSVTAQQGGTWNVGVPALTSTSIAYPITTTGSSTVSGTVTVGNIVPVSSTNLGIRPLTSASDTVGAVQSGTWNVNVLEDSGISANSIAYPVTPTGGTIGRIIQDIPATNLNIRPLRSDSDTITVANVIGDIKATNFGIRPLTSSSDTVSAVQSGTWNFGNAGTVGRVIGDVNATNLNIRPLRSDSDTITVANIIGGIKATNLGIRPLTSASDTVAISDGTQTLSVIATSDSVSGKTGVLLYGSDGSVARAVRTNSGGTTLVAQNNGVNLHTFVDSFQGTNVNIRPLRSDSDTVTAVQSGSWAVITPVGSYDQYARFKTTTDEYTQKIAYDSSNNPTYLGWALPGTSQSTASWRIQQIVYDVSNNPIDIKWADGNPMFDNAWTSRISASFT